MLTRFKQQLTYANVTASIALFFALGGASYAALKLPRDSVGSNQIRAGAVSTSEIRDRSIGLADVSPGARKYLRGKSGATGPAGPAGPPAAKYFAALNAAGAIVRGNATTGGHGSSAGTYSVGFAQSVSACAVSATLGSTDATAVPPGRVTTSEENGQVVVRTFDQAGTPLDLPFQLLLAC